MTQKKLVLSRQPQKRIAHKKCKCCLLLSRVLTAEINPTEEERKRQLCQVEINEPLQWTAKALFVGYDYIQQRLFTANVSF